MSKPGSPQRQNKAKKFMVIIRPGFKKICADDACRAGMFNHILYNIAKQKQAGSDYWFSTGDAIWEETDRSWGKSKTLKEIKDLESTGIVARMRNPRNSWDQTRYYTFGEDQAKALHELCVKNEVCLASMRLPSAVTHLLNLTNAYCKNNKCICCNQQIDLLNPTNPFVENEIFPGDESASQAGSETPSEDSYQDSAEDSFTPARESENDQIGQPPSEEKKLTVPSQIAYSHKTETNHVSSKVSTNTVEVARDPGYMQTTTATIDTPSQVPVVVTQVAPPTAEPVPLIPPEPKPARHTFGNLREGLDERDVRQVSKAEQARLDAAEQREKDKRAKRRTEEVWTLYSKITSSSKAIRDHWSEKAVKALVEGDATDEQITQTYNWLKNKKMLTTLSYIASNLNSCMADLAGVKPANKPKSELVDFTNWTDDEWDHYQRTGEKPVSARRA